MPEMWTSLFIEKVTATAYEARMWQRSSVSMSILLCQNYTQQQFDETYPQPPSTNALT
ncbi:hypothetical protein C0J52_13334 [Blattella germanica]|nr:hypothetical protein C0J52_13334 [Blattella germanica]